MESKCGNNKSDVGLLVIQGNEISWTITRHEHLRVNASVPAGSEARTSLITAASKVGVHEGLNRSCTVRGSTTSALRPKRLPSCAQTDAFKIITTRSHMRFVAYAYKRLRISIETTLVPAKFCVISHWCARGKSLTLKRLRDSSLQPTTPQRQQCLIRRYILIMERHDGLARNNDTWQNLPMTRFLYAMIAVLISRVSLRNRSVIVS